MIIESRRGELAADFQRVHGRPPTPVESLKLAQQATLETRDAKHEPRTLTEQRASWHNQAAQILGGPDAVERMVRTALHPGTVTAPLLDDQWIDEAAGRVLAVIERRPLHLAVVACPGRGAAASADRRPRSGADR